MSVDGFGRALSSHLGNLPSLLDHLLSRGERAAGPIPEIRHTVSKESLIGRLRRYRPFVALLSLE
jgi:hypothetical protein